LENEILYMIDKLFAIYTEVDMHTSEKDIIKDKILKYIKKL